MRSCLRTGHVEVTDPELARRINARSWVDAVEARGIRDASQATSTGPIEQSGTGVAAADDFFFALGQKTCLAVAPPPRCDECVLSSCTRAVDRIQQLFRETTC